jgi:hypothetical protein
VVSWAASCRLPPHELLILFQVVPPAGLSAHAGLRSKFDRGMLFPSMAPFQLWRLFRRLQTGMGEAGLEEFLELKASLT